MSGRRTGAVRRGAPRPAAPLLAGLLLAGLLGACGVKAPPRAAGAPEKAPPSDVFQPPRSAHP